MKNRNKDTLLIISLFLVAFSIRAVGVSNVFLYPDEWYYWIRANLILANNLAPPQEVFEHTAPFLSYIMAGVTLLFGGELNTLRMISVFFGSSTAPMLYLFGKAMYDRKTGLLSALFLCFSPYHILYSRILMLEALTLFFIVTFLYFFWMSQRFEDRASIIYAIIAGAMLGLAIDAKYLPFFLVLTILIYAFWINRCSFKELMTKRIILVLFFAFLFFAPLLICVYTVCGGLDPLSYQTVERFKTETHERSFAELAPPELFVSVLEKNTDVFAWGAQILNPLWAVIFKLSTTLLFLIAFFYYLFKLINKEGKDSFLIINILVLYICLLILSPTRHYILYSLPFYFVMFSHLAVKSFDHMRKNSHKNIFRIFIILLTGIMLFSSFVPAVTSSYWDAGEYSWVKSAVGYIENDVTKSDYEGTILIGWVTLWKIVDYSIDMSKFIAFDTILIEQEENKYCLDLEKIDRLKPEYLLVREARYDVFFKGSVETNILRDYEMVFHSQTYPYRALVFKRKNIQPPELVFPTDGKDGKIDQDMFKKSVPNMMKLGEVYTVLASVENTGDSRTTFTVWGYSDEYTIFVEPLSVKDMHELTLDKGSRSIVKFKIVPFKEYVGELPITIDLYVKYKENESHRKVDSSTDYVYLVTP